MNGKCWRTIEDGCFLGPIPPVLAERLAGGEWIDSSGGCTAATVRRIRLPTGREMILKSSPPVQGDTLAAERDRLDWLRERVPVPQVHEYSFHAGYEHLLMSAVPGRDLAAIVESAVLLPRGDWAGGELLVRALAALLRRLHLEPVGACPFDSRLSVKLAEARRRVDEGLVDASEFEDAFLGMDPLALLRRLEAIDPPAEDLVVAHGDACLPNFLLDEQGLISGVIDVGRLGVADRWQDLALVVRSLDHNGVGHLAKPFLDAYGMAPDADKITFYQLLDEFY